MERREFMQKGSGTAVLGLMVAAGWLPGVSHAQAAAWNKAAFDAKTLADVAKALGGSAPVESKEVDLQAPEIAENGNVVRLAATSKLPGTSQVAFLVEKNPYVLSAAFDVPAGTEASFSTNVKMGQSTNVYAIAKVGDKYYYAVKEVKVTLGGCGG
jgi:sulfur-oxidizing protein SoxY